MTGTGVDTLGNADGSLTDGELASLLAGDILLTPPKDSGVDFTLQVTATTLTVVHRRAVREPRRRMGRGDTRAHHPYS